MPRWSKRSHDELATCHPELQAVFNTVIGGFDCTVIEGQRSEATQEEAYRTGNSKLRFPFSKHNTEPSLGVDVAPYPINWNDIRRFDVFAGYVLGVASQLGIEIRWGGDWDRDTDVHDQSFNDLVHFELVE
jgi:peptidoglycan L-alanyl-D-glutamate endopeptidase CwlK